MHKALPSMLSPVHLSLYIVGNSARYCANLLSCLPSAGKGLILCSIQKSKYLLMYVLKLFLVPGWYPFLMEVDTLMSNAASLAIAKINQLPTVSHFTNIGCNRYFTHACAIN